jgi:hypothetical protein
MQLIRALRVYALSVLLHHALDRALPLLPFPQRPPGRSLDKALQEREERLCSFLAKSKRLVKGSSSFGAMHPHLPGHGTLRRCTEGAPRSFRPSG